MTLQEEILFDEYFRCYAIGRKHVHIMRYDPRQPHANRYVKDAKPVDEALESRVRADCLKLVHALGYDFDTLEFAVRDGIPYAIDFLNPAPDADPSSVGQTNYEWVLEHAADWLIERVTQGVPPPRQYHWQEFLAGSSSKPSAARTPSSRVPSGGAARRSPTSRPKQ
jgi:hypothetical protein